MPLGLEAEWVPKLTARGPVGSVARVEWSLSMEGPWTVWTNVTVGVGGNVLVDLTPGAVSRFYRAVGDPKPVGPEGFVWIEPGSFVMGSPANELDRSSDETQHTVTLTQGFWLSDHETTQAEYQAVMGGQHLVVQGGHAAGGTGELGRRSLVLSEADGTGASGGADYGTAGL